jgi:hypothetical protein
MEIVIAIIVVVALGAIWYTNRKTGFDTNQDGKIDLADAKAAVENTVAVVKETADVNKDGKVDAADVEVVKTKAKTAVKKTATKAKATVKKAATKATSTRGRKPKSA